MDFKGTGIIDYLKKYNLLDRIHKVNVKYIGMIAVAVYNEILLVHTTHFRVSMSFFRGFMRRSIMYLQYSGYRGSQKMYYNQ